MVPTEENPRVRRNIQTCRQPHRPGRSETAGKLRRPCHPAWLGHPLRLVGRGRRPALRYLSRRGRRGTGRARRPAPGASRVFRRGQRRAGSRRRSARPRDGRTRRVSETGHRGLSPGILRAWRRNAPDEMDLKGICPGNAGRVSVRALSSRAAAAGSRSSSAMAKAEKAPPCLETPHGARAKPGSTLRIPSPEPVSRCRPGAASAAVEPHQFDELDHLGLGERDDFLAGRTGRRGGDLLVERTQTEVIAARRFSHGRTGTGIARFALVVDRLPESRLERRRAESRSQKPRLERHAPGCPVAEHADRRVGRIHLDEQFLGAFGKVGPPEGRRDVFAVACEPDGNGFTRVEVGTGQNKHPRLFSQWFQRFPVWSNCRKAALTFVNGGPAVTRNTGRSGETGLPSEFLPYWIAAGR